MAYRLDKAVLRGEISNITPNQVTGKIWLVGLKYPLEIKLEGNCLRDIAGCTLNFVNPRPRPEKDLEGLCPEQRGMCGDMTASRKVRIPLISEEDLMEYLQEKKPVPSRLANMLYLEWFSETNGRVVIEGADFQMQVSEPKWNMSAEAEAEQIVTSQESFFRFLNDLAGLDLQNQEDEDDFEEDEDEDADEFVAGDGPWSGKVFQPFKPGLQTPVLPPPAPPTANPNKADQADDLSWEEFLSRLEDPAEVTKLNKKTPQPDSVPDDLPWEEFGNQELASLESEPFDGPEDVSGLSAAAEDEFFQARFDELAELEDLEELPLDEFEWEQEFRAMDRKAAAYQEAFDRYRHHPDREKLIADAMGWEFTDMDEMTEEWDDVTTAFANSKDLEPNSDPLLRLFDEEEVGATHPLSRRAMRLALKLQEDVDSMDLGNNRDQRDHQLYSVIVSVISVGGKLASALDNVANGFEPDRGFVIAMLKRSQVPLNEALHALACIEQSSMPRDAQMWIATVRSELFDLRKDVLDVMAAMRDS